MRSDSCRNIEVFELREIETGPLTDTPVTVNLPPINTGFLVMFERPGYVPSLGGETPFYFNNRGVSDVLQFGAVAGPTGWDVTFWSDPNLQNVNWAYIQANQQYPSVVQFVDEISYPTLYQAPSEYGAITYRVYSDVPLPAAVWLLGPGLVGLAALRRRFKK